MISLRDAIVIISSILYGVALASGSAVKVDTKHKKLSEISYLILTMACITSISFMSTVFEVNKYVEYLCFVIMLVIVLVGPIVTKLILTKLKKK